jgi:hypothetical protein
MGPNEAAGALRRICGAAAIRAIYFVNFCGEMVGKLQVYPVKV